MITMRIDATTSGQSRVTWLSASVLSPEEALDEFVGNSKPGRQIGNPTTVTILTKDVRSCPKIDWDRTVHLASHLPELKEAHLDMAWTIRYPLVCAGDPFYVVYYSKGGLLRIDEFELTEFDAEPRWWYDSSSRARPVPLVARRNVNDGPWYRVVEPEPPR